jgi:hypothetical protein
MTALAARGDANATFIEHRYVPVLDAPVQSSGTLRFVAPDRLEKHTLQPRAESMVLAGNQLTLQQGQRTRSLALSDLPDNGLASTVCAARWRATSRHCVAVGLSH